MSRFDYTRNTALLEQAWPEITTELHRDGVVLLHVKRDAAS